MTDLLGDVVVDASVGIKLVLLEPYSEMVDRLFAMSLLNHSGSIFVPDLFFVECANILWKTVRRGDIPREKAEGGIAYLRTLRLKVVSTRDLMQQAFEIACLHNITAYDACYAALSERMEAPLLTADNRLAQALSAGSFDIVTLERLWP